MLEVIIYLRRYGEGEREQLVRIEIGNDSTGTHEIGNYDYSIVTDNHGDEKLERLTHTGTPSRKMVKGRIENFPRQKGNAIELLKEILNKEII